MTKSASNRASKTITAGTPEIQALLTALSDLPQQIARIARGRGDEVLHRKPGPDAWSAQEIVAHLRACADLWGKSIDRMLSEDHPTIRYVSPRGWIRKTTYLQANFADSLREFSTQRARLHATLSRLAPRDWGRGATFTGTTRGREATVLDYARRIADHEAIHMDQLRRTIVPAKGR